MRDLAESEEVEELLLVDLDVDRARATSKRQAAVRLPSRAAWRSRRVVTPPATVSTSTRCARAPRPARTTWTSAAYRLTGEKFDLHEDFERAGLIVILGMGSSPARRT